MPKPKGRTLSRLVVPMSIKAVTDANGVHTFEGLAATWQKDLGNDVIKKGAFKNTIAEWKSSSDALPLLNSHDAYDIFSAIGQMMDAKETADGLWTKWALLPGPEGDAVHNRIQQHPMTGKSTVGKMSIGYEPVKFSYEQPEGTTSFWDQIRHLDEVKLVEVSLVLFPMNPGAAIDPSTVKQFMSAIKSADPATLDALSRHQLRELSGRIGNLLKKHTENDEPKNAPKIVTSSTRKSPTPPSETPETDDDTEELDIASELLDEQDAEERAGRRKPSTPVSDDESETDDADGESPSDESDDSDESRDETEQESATDTSTTEDEKSHVQPYLYSEALQQRLQALKIRRIASGGAREDDE